jgi:hypothetical protein
VDSNGDLYVGEVSWTNWPQTYRDKPRPDNLRSLHKFVHFRETQLSNRLDAETRGKVIDAVHARVPMVTPDEQRLKAPRAGGRQCSPARTR